MNYFSFYGTMSRKPFWLISIAMAILLILEVCLIASEIDALIVIGLILMCITLWCNLAITTKRIRDCGCSGWFVLVWMMVSGIPVIGQLVGIVWLCLPTKFLERYTR